MLDFAGIVSAPATTVPGSSGPVRRRSTMCVAAGLRTAISSSAVAVGFTMVRKVPAGPDGAAVAPG